MKEIERFCFQKRRTFLLVCWTRCHNTRRVIKCFFVAASQKSVEVNQVRLISVPKLLQMIMVKMSPNTLKLFMVHTALPLWPKNCTHICLIESYYLINESYLKSMRGSVSYHTALTQHNVVWFISCVKSIFMSVLKLTPFSSDVFLLSYWAKKMPKMPKMTIDLYIWLSVCLSIRLLTICLSVCLSIISSVCLSVCTQSNCLLASLSLGLPISD